MTDSPTEPSSDRSAASPAMRVLVVVMLLVPLVGIAIHAVLYFRYPDLVRPYLLEGAVWISVVLAFANLVASWIAHRRTRMGLCIAARVLTYVWIVSLVLMFKSLMSG